MPGWQPLVGFCDGVTNPCDFADFITLIKNGITDLVLLSTLLVVAMLAYAGINLLMSGGNAGARTDAKDMGLKVVKGYMWILVAWLLVYTITSTLLKPEFFFLLGSPGS